MNGRNAEVVQFQENGYWIEARVFSSQECERIQSVVGTSEVPRARGGIRNLISVPEVEAFANDRRLLELAACLFGRELAPFKATLFVKTGKANWLVSWHQDTALPVENVTDEPEWGPVSMKAGVKFAHAPAWALSKILALRIQLDDSGADNGPLRVIPGSHKRKLSTDSELSDLVAARNEVVCVTERGGVIAMSPLIVHASSKARTDAPRRVLHIEYAESLDLAPGVRLARA